MTLTGPPLPVALPAGYEYLDGEEPFDPATDLDLDLAPPAETRTLAEFGYGTDFAGRYPSGLAIAGPLRVLSDRGVAKLRLTLERLRPFAIWGATTASPGIIRGAVYRSRFVRDLCASGEVAAFLGDVVGAPLVPTPIGHQLAHVNLPPRDGSGLVGRWHVDQNSYVLVLAVHDPARTAGGRFQYYRGRRDEALSVLGERGELPYGDVQSMALPGPGWGVLMQGSAVVHRAEPLAASAPRVTVVTSYEPTDPTYPDQNPRWLVDTGYEDDPHGQLEIAARTVEFARHKAWRSRNSLDRFLSDVCWGRSEDEIVAMLAGCVRDLVQACTAIRQGPVPAGQALAEFIRHEA